eukprot:COSAG02_NODE_20653_length_821_cov_0.585873_1_plen_198_part_01
MSPICYDLYDLIVIALSISNPNSHPTYSLNLSSGARARQPALKVTVVPPGQPPAEAAISRPGFAWLPCFFTSFIGFRATNAAAAAAVAAAAAASAEQPLHGGAAACSMWPPNASHIECDMDIGHQPAAKNPQACAAACCAQAKCAAWQWSNASCGASAGCGCWLGHRNDNGKPAGCHPAMAWVGASRVPPDNAPPPPA